MDEVLIWAGELILIFIATPLFLLLLVSITVVAELSFDFVSGIFNLDTSDGEEWGWWY